MRVHLGWLFLSCLAGAAPVWAEDPAEAAARQVKEARAKVEAKDYASAFDLYAGALAALPGDRAILTDAANAALLAKKLDDALGWAKRAVHEAPESFTTSPKGKEAEALIPRIEAAIKQKPIDDRAFAANCVAAAIQALSKEQEMLKFAWLEQDKDAPATYRVREAKVDAWMLSGRVQPDPDGKHLTLSLRELFDDRASAEERVKVIKAQIREQKRPWERRFTLRTGSAKYELGEMTEVVLDETSDEDVTRKTPTTTFCWDPRTTASAVRTAVATVELHLPWEGRTDKTKKFTSWIVMTRLTSRTFK